MKTFLTAMIVFFAVTLGAALSPIIIGAETKATKDNSKDMSKFAKMGEFRKLGDKLDNISRRLNALEDRLHNVNGKLGSLPQPEVILRGDTSLIESFQKSLDEYMKLCNSHDEVSQSMEYIDDVAIESAKKLYQQQEEIKRKQQEEERAKQIENWKKQVKPFYNRVANIQVDILKKELGIDNAQAEKLAKIYTTAADAMVEQMSSRFTPGRRPTEEDRKEGEKAMEEFQNNLNNEVKAVLTGDQYDKYIETEGLSDFSKARDEMMKTFGGGGGFRPGR